MAVNAIGKRHTHADTDQSAWNTYAVQPKVWPPQGVLFSRARLEKVLKTMAEERIFTIYKAGPDPQGRPFKFAKIPVSGHGYNLTGDWQKDQRRRLTLSEAMEGAEALVVRNGGGYGVGVVFTGAKGDFDGYREVRLAAIDIDGCRNPFSGEVSPEVEELLNKEELRDTYWEVSPSGRGIRGLCFVQEMDKLPDTKVIIDGAEVGFELFISSKWVTLTGEAL